MRAKICSCTQNWPIQNSIFPQRIFFLVLGGWVRQIPTPPPPPAPVDKHIPGPHGHGSSPAAPAAGSPEAPRPCPPAPALSLSHPPPTTCLPSPQEYTQDAVLVVVFDVIHHMTKLTDQMAEERGMSMRYMDASGAGARAALQEQRALLDAAAADFTGHLVQNTWHLPARLWLRASVCLNIIDELEDVRVCAAAAGPTGGGGVSSVLVRESPPGPPPPPLPSGLRAYNPREEVEWRPLLL